MRHDKLHTDTRQPEFQHAMTHCIALSQMLSSNIACSDCDVWHEHNAVRGTAASSAQCPVSAGVTLYVVCDDEKSTKAGSGNRDASDATERNHDIPIIPTIHGGIYTVHCTYHSCMIYCVMHTTV